MKLLWFRVKEWFAIKRFNYPTHLGRPKQLEDEPLTLTNITARYTDPSGIIKYLIDRTNHRDVLFKDIESAVLGKNYTEALKLAREGWQLRGR